METRTRSKFTKPKGGSATSTAATVTKSSTSLSETPLVNRGGAQCVQTDSFSDANISLSKINEIIGAAICKPNAVDNLRNVCNVHVSTENLVSDISTSSNVALTSIQSLIEIALDRHYDRLSRMFSEKLDDAIRELRDDFIVVESDIVDLKSETKSLSERMTLCENNVVSNTDVCSEIQDREKRSKNVILHGLSECESTEDDLLCVNSLLAKLPDKPIARAVSRLGKQINDKIRPLKLFFDSKEIPIFFLKMQNFLNQKN